VRFFPSVATDIEELVRQTLETGARHGFECWPNAPATGKSAWWIGFPRANEQKALRERARAAITDLPQDLSGRQAAPTRQWTAGIAVLRRTFRKVF